MLDAAESLELDVLQSHFLHVIGQTLSQNNFFGWILMLRTYAHHPPARWIDELDALLVRFLTHTLPQQFANGSMANLSVSFGSTTSSENNAGGASLAGMMDLARIYSRLPLEYLKRCLEHPDLVIHDTLLRYRFAKQVLSLREEQGACGLSVFLQFEGEGRVIIGRKQTLKRGHWDLSLYE